LWTSGPAFGPEGLERRPLEQALPQHPVALHPAFFGKPVHRPSGQRRVAEKLARLVDVEVGQIVIVKY